MIGYKELCVACSKNDEVAEEKHGFEAVMDDLDLDVQDVIRAAEQRAMRFVILQIRKEKLVPYAPFVLRPGEEPIYNLIMASWVDGLVAGVRVG
jgi:hypothetical protein